MVSKLLILGMDGLDFDVIRKYSSSLPNLEELQKKDGYPRMTSIFPADTTPAWSTVYLGVDPSYHGIINFINMADKNNSYKSNDFDDSAFFGKTFWDDMARNGLKCGVVLPMNIKKGWDVPNGIMITRPFGKKGYVYPREKTKIYRPNYKLLSTDAKFTSEAKLYKLETLFLKKADEEKRLTLEVLKNETLDVLFSYFSTPDGMQHDFWSYCDETHKDYVEGNQYKDAVLNIYKKMDETIGIIRQLYPTLKILIISDHGHGARPVKTIRLNEILRREGFLVPSKQKKQNKKQNNGLKGRLFKLIRKIGLPKFVVKLAKKIPVWKKIMAPSDIIDWDNTIAYLSDLSAVKNYSYGGIKINSKINDKDAVADNIISSLMKYEQDGKPLFTWIVRTNSFYHGPFLCKYPEIIFQMNEAYGAGWELGDELVVEETSFNTISPGGHRYFTATICACNFELPKKNWCLSEMRELIETITKGC